MKTTVNDSRDFGLDRVVERSAFTPEHVITNKDKGRFSEINRSGRLVATALLNGKCADCGFIAWLLPAKLPMRDLRRINEKIVHQRCVKKGEYLFQNGSPLCQLKVIKSGFLKISISDEGGRNQITGIAMTGEIIGLDALDTGKHQCEAVALENSQLCGLALRDFQKLACAIPALQQYFHQVMGKEMTRSREIMRLLAGKRAEVRIATFLLNVSDRLVAYGHPGHQFRLPIKRKDIGNHLSLTLETVSRVFARFNEDELIETYRKEITLKDLVRLREISKG